jgi:hypothetical protein
MAAGPISSTASLAALLRLGLAPLVHAPLLVLQPSSSLVLVLALVLALTSHLS